MTISSLHHINIQTTKLEETRDFYERVLGLYIGARPDFGNYGYWLFLPGSDHPIVHLSQCAVEGPDQMLDAGNRIDHVAFFGHDLEGTLKHLDKMGIDYTANPDRLYLDAKMVQVFMKDPNGINVELGFFPERDAMFRESMAEQQANARKGDKKLKGKKTTKAKAKPATAKKAKKSTREKVPA
jgi:catechol 2,3-dioxygenase-like lactoylglutathione lyase family enzyme